MRTILLDEALRATMEAEHRARADGGLPVCLCVTDGSGDLLAFARMDGAPERLVPIVIAKAYTAVRMRATTEGFRKRLLDGGLTLADFCDPLLTSLPGGVPLLAVDGRCVGAVAVSGRALADDAALAGTYARLLEERLDLTRGAG